MFQADAVVDMIGYPKYIENDTALNLRYQKVTMVTGVHSST